MRDRRRAADKAWSARSSVEWYDAAGRRLPGPDGAARAVLRWRHRDASRRRTFAGPGMAARLREATAVLAAAYEGDWPADPSGWPTPPTPLPAAETTVALRAVPVRDPLPAARPDAPRTVADLLDWYYRRMTSTVSKRGRSRSGKTLGSYRSSVEFAKATLVYRVGDPRLGAAGARPGDPLLLDEETGLGTADLVTYLDVRRATDLRARAVNDRRLARWHDAVVREAALAARHGRLPVPVEPPALEPERASARTVEEAARVVKDALGDAHRRGLISYQPWTADVDDEVPRPETTHYTTRTVPGPDQIVRLAEAVASRRRRGVGADGRPADIDGTRYRALVLFAGLQGCRPGELEAMRVSWLDLDAATPQVGYRGSDSHQSTRVTGAAAGRVAVELKHRGRGEIRRQPLHPVVVDALREHLRLFVPVPDPASPDLDRRDPRVFTTHLGAPLDLGNFAAAWFRPAVAATFVLPGEEHFGGLAFRELRHAGITRLLREGHTTERVARWVGNSQAVIEKHYKGVIDEADPVPGDGFAAATALTAIDLTAVGPAELAALAGRCTAELARRSAGT